MPSNTRDKMIEGAIELMRSRGVNATSTREVVRHTDTPRGSIRHHFPQGKRQLIHEALTDAGERITGLLQRQLAQQNTATALTAFADYWQRELVNSDYALGCPVMAVSVERYLGEDGQPDAQASDALLDQAAAIFSGWETLLSHSLQKEGLQAQRAQDLAAFIVMSLEGAIATSRARRSTAPLRLVVKQLAVLIESARS